MGLDFANLSKMKSKGKRKENNLCACEFN